MVFSRRETAILVIGDFLILAFSLWIAIAIRNLAVPPWGYFESNSMPFLPIFFLSLTIFYIAGLYEKQTRPIRRVMGVRILGAQAATVSIAAILFFILPLSIAPKTILILYLGVSVVAESLWRFYRMNREMRAGTRELAFLIGSGAAVTELYDEVNNNDRFLIRFTAHQETIGLREGEVRAAIIAVIQKGIQVVVIDLSDPIVARELPRLYELMTKKVTMMTFASLYEEVFDRIPLAHLNAEQLLESISERRTVYDTSKRIFDILLALMLACIAIPVLALTVLVLAWGGGTPLITNERIGKGGHVFHILKLRSMLFNDGATQNSKRRTG